MSRFVRNSKYRHVFADTPKKQNVYDNVKVTGSAWDTDLISASASYLAINWQVAGGGAFGVLPLLNSFSGPIVSGFPHKLPDLVPLARGHTGPVLDTDFSPHNDSLVASASEDGKILLWNIKPEVFEGWGEENWELPPDLEWSGKLVAGGGRKVGQIKFNPLAEGLLASASGDHAVRLWDIKSESAPQITLTGHKDAIQCMAWNGTGTLLATTSRDRKLRIFDPRAGTEAVKIADGHGGIKGSRVVWLGDKDRLITTGFSKMSDRQLMLWETGGLTSLKTETIDSSSGVIMPFYAEGNGIIFLAGKGDGNIRYYEYESDELHYISEYKSAEAQRGMCFLPRRALDVGANEIARAFKLTTDKVEPLGFVVPRKADSFQADIFPPAFSKEPSLSAADWLAGKTPEPKMVDLESGAVETLRAHITKSQSLPNPAPASFSISTPATAPVPAPVPAHAPMEEKKPVSNEREGSLPSLKDIEIKQDDPDSDEEITDAKKRAPDDDDFEDDQPVRKVDETKKATSVSPVSNVEKESKVEEVNGSATEVKTNNGEVGALKSEITDLKRKVADYEGKITTLQKQLEKARSIGKDLAAL